MAKYPYKSVIGSVMYLTRCTRPDLAEAVSELDWITDLPPSHYHDAILVVVCRLTKMAIFIKTTKSMPAPDVAALFVEHVIRIHDLPSNIVSDRFDAEDQENVPELGG